MGPQHVTAEAAEALRSLDRVLAFGKGEDDPLLAIRAEVCRQYGDPPLVHVPDPPRDRVDPEDYPAAVRTWHAARVAALRSAIDERPGVVGMLVWGDPSLYDSTLRLLDALDDVAYDVVPGISAPQLLAARHRVVLHGIGEPVHLTTGRRLGEAIAAGHDNVLAMLNRDVDLTGLEEWQIWWGANLGAPGEQLVSGRVGDVADEIGTARERARSADGWMMDLFLLRRTPR
ncbi:precorrin-6A synthase (deacetylating) [Nocardioides pocheonensis]|jgi:precorrin-6A synthase|uniref:Precorrin-6A synthase (Deacetylating) n=2 Tax=Nocardioides pocheonensis TaxID=661485 RepID=A0A3N0GQG5_9ACTN|nr:precorrin-6A synthase (deacetylating) [Nocardioides pocheonensis]